MSVFAGIFAQSLYRSRRPARRSQGAAVPLRDRQDGPALLPAHAARDVWRMVRRRASDAGIETAIGCQTFRATGITDYLTNGGRIEVAQHMAGHSNARTT